MASYWLAQYLKTEPEKQQIINAIAAFNSYKTTASALLSKRRRLYSRLSWQNKKLAAQIGYTARLDLLASLHEQNAKLFEDLTKYACNKYQVTATDLFLVKKHQSPIALLELMIRDWTDSHSYLYYVIRFFEEQDTTTIHNNFAAKNSRILIPGAGLGRLAHELIKRGFTNVDAMDFSYACTITSEFLAQIGTNTSTNQQHQHQYTVYPYTHQFSHQVSQEAQARPCKIPTEKPLAKVVYGDFTEWGRNNPSFEPYDIIITVFFIDTAEDIFSYLDNIKRLLKPGGTWINLGPIKWGTAPKAELNVEELKQLIRLQGWKLDNEYKSTNEYFVDELSLWRGTYGIVGWTATYE